MAMIKLGEDGENSEQLLIDNVNGIDFDNNDLEIEGDELELEGGNIAHGLVMEGTGLDVEENNIENEVNGFENDCEQMLEIEDRGLENSSEDVTTSQGNIYPPPVGGMEFDSYDDAYNYYNQYGKDLGFAIRVKSSWTKRNSKEKRGAVLCCNCEGFKTLKEANSRRKETRTGCLAMIRLRLVESNRWTTTNMKRSSSSNSNSNFDSQQQQQQYQHSQTESPHSPLRFHSPLRSFSPLNSPENPSVDDSKAVVAVSKVTHHTTAPPPPSSKSTAAPGTAVNRVVWEEVPQSARKVEPEGGRAESGGVPSVRRRSGKEEKLRLAELCFRIGELCLCLISFSIMAANKTKGWSGDSFNRYKEYIYCLSVNVIGCAYSALQAYDMGYYMGTGKHVIRNHWRWHINFFIDQILAYLLVSASSSAATRVDDWQSNWGKDEFTEMATASVAMSFLAFGAFAVSSIISGYNFCNRESI